jgi:hypothetical protein
MAMNEIAKYLAVEVCRQYQQSQNLIDKIRQAKQVMQIIEKGETN